MIPARHSDAYDPEPADIPSADELDWIKREGDRRRDETIADHQDMHDRGECGTCPDDPWPGGGS